MEADVLQLLLRSPGKKFSAKEVSKLVDRKQYRDHHTWARPFLERLVGERRIWKDTDALYFYSPEDERKKEEEKKTG
jgi:hypothetical protein